MRDDVDARCCLRCEDARWYRGGLPGHLADCLRLAVPSANTYGSPAAAQCALQVSQRLRRSVALHVSICVEANALACNSISAPQTFLRVNVFVPFLLFVLRLFFPPSLRYKDQHQNTL